LSKVIIGGTGTKQVPFKMCFE